MSASRGGKQFDLWAQIGFYTSLGFIVPAGAVGGYLLGWLLDDWLSTKPVLAVVIAIVGAAGGILEVLQLLTRAEKRTGGNDPNRGSGSS
ncbi:MAG: AtpZ/AtpI family protein [Acidobacteria bacterium]|nr:AtpZ/AtpI family protein [Acidobacteriota bacterium]